jgi:hypothetical protein
MGNFPGLSMDKWCIGALILQEFWHTIHYVSTHNLPNFPVQFFTHFRTIYMEFLCTVHGIFYAKYIEFPWPHFP